MPSARRTVRPSSQPCTAALEARKRFPRGLAKLRLTLTCLRKSSPHGVRKAACRRLAEAGCTALEIMSITGHTDIREIERYCRAAERKGLAATAMTKLQAGFDIKLPNPPRQLGKSARKSLKSLVAKADWRSRQESNLQPSE
ncbi:tyrosine-type recombinase/integrase [Bradyrhizobium sp. LB13.1]